MNMLKHNLGFTKKAYSELIKLERDTDITIIERLKELGDGVIKGKRLKGRFRGLLSLRVGKYRIIYEEPKYCEIIIIDIRHRESAYTHL